MIQQAHLSVYSVKNWKPSPQEILVHYFQSSTIQNSALGVGVATQVSIHRWMKKQNVI